MTRLRLILLLLLALPPAMRDAGAATAAMHHPSSHRSAPTQPVADRTAIGTNPHDAPRVRHATGASMRGWTTHAGWDALVLTLLAAGTGAGVRLGRRGLMRRRIRRRRDRAMRLAVGEVVAKQRALQIRRLQLVSTDAYGTIDLSKWHRERAYFLRTRILPLLETEQVADQWPLIAGAVHRQLETLAAAEPDAQATNADTSAGPAAFVSDPRRFDPRMTPGDYERHCAWLLRRSGWDTRVTAASGDQGADVLARRNGTALVVQCKLYGRPVGNAAVQQASAARLHQRAQLAAVVSNAGFTASAKQLARTNDVHLLHHEQLLGFQPVGPTPKLGRRAS